jgi:uncharacterized membrane protein
MSDNNSITSKIMKYASFNQFGVMSMLLIFIGCLSGVTVGLVGFSNDVALISIIIPTMSTLALILSIQPIKYILIAGLITTIVDLLLLTTLLF